MFVDVAKIYVKAGDGGKGAVSFHRERSVVAGGPDGGDGGRGGDVIFKIDDHMSTLIDFKYKKKFVAQDGQPGGRKKCSGKSGEDLVIKVPKGTIVRDSKTGRLIMDLSSSEDKIIAKGGRGGWGNQHFANSKRQTPRFSKPGIPGEVHELTLELKLLADVGIVGFPNVGKSTLISAMSDARPQIANYHFTTLVPVLGVVKLEDGNSFVMADIPGLIEGASIGVGLGHQFLRHVERCRLILHVVDISGIEGRDPIEDFKKINKELEQFNPELAQRPQIVVGNKCDLASEEQVNNFQNFIQSAGLEYYTLSAATRKGIGELINHIAVALQKLPPIKRFEPEPIPDIELEAVNDRQFNIFKDGEDFVIEADWLFNILQAVNMDDYESLHYFQRVLKTSGITHKMEEMGIKDGDTVRIFNLEFEYLR